MLNSIPNIKNKDIILGGDFNLFFDTLLETQGGNSSCGPDHAVKNHIMI